LWQDRDTSRIYKITESGTYNLTVLNINNCKASASIYVNERCPAIYIPDAFTPNGDG